MLQATARQLQQSVCEYEAKLEAAYTRMQSGEAPTDDIDQEWRRMLRLQETRQREDEMRKQVSNAVTPVQVGVVACLVCNSLAWCEACG